ncbi:MAG TPA: hypothetical protein VIR03_00060 [Candidatus Saccharimonadales bacterium]
MENKDQNYSLSYGLDEGQALTGGTVREAPLEPGALPLESENPGPVSSQAQPKGQANLFLRFARRADVLLFVLLVVTGVALLFITRHQQTQQAKNSTSSVSEYGDIKIPLSDLTAGKQLTLAGAANVTINGPMQLNDTLILAPSLQPTGAKPGQLYFDQTNNQLAYYNGSAFVFLTAQNPLTGLQSLGGATGQLGLGAGLTITNNQLINNGVLSVQGQTGAVKLNAGPGIVINGTTFSNSGVLSVAPGDSHIIVASDGSGNIRLSVTGTGTGTVTSGGGTNGVVPLFTGSQNIENSIISQAGMTVTISGDLSVVTGGLSLANALTVSNGGIGTTSLAGNGVLVGNGTAAVSSVAAGSAGLCLLSTVGAPAWGACPASGGVVSLNGLSGALSLANASAAGSTITIDNASTTVKGIASFNATNFSVSGGAVDTIQNLNTGATPAFAGLNTNIITPSGALTVGATGQAFTLQGTASSVLTATSGANTTTLGFATPTANVTYRLQTATAGIYDICTTAGNCDTPNEITSPGGTVNTLAKFTGAQIIGDSIIADNGTTVSIGGVLSVSSTSLFTGQITTNGGITATGALTITSGGAGALTVGASTQQLILQGNSSTQMVVTSGLNTTTVTFAAPTSNVTYRFPTATAGIYDICSTAGNCAGSGGGVTTPGGTNNAIPKFTGAQTLGSSSITDNGANVTTTESVVIQGGTVTLGLAATTTGSIDLMHSASSFVGTIVQGSMTASRTYTLPDVSGTICTSAGNCSGVGSSNTLQAAYDAGNTIATSSGRDIAFTLAHTTVDANFTVTIATGSTGTASIVRAAGGGTADPAQLLLLANQDTVRSVPVGLKIQSAAGGITTAIDLTDANIATALNVGAHNISGTTGGLSFTNFAIAGASGNITTNGTVNGQTISSTASFTGSLSVAGATTVGGSLAANGGNITSTGALTVTPGGTLMLGATDQQLILQGNASTQLTATSGGFTTTVGFTGVPTAAVTYNFDRTSAAGVYTICTSLGNCAGAGSGVTTTGGTVGTLPVFTASQAIGNSLVSQSGGTVTVNGNLNLITGNTFQVNGTQISSANLSNDANLAKLSGSETFTGNTIAFQNAANSSNALNIQNNVGTRLFTADTSSGYIVLGTASTLNGTLVFNNVNNANTVTVVPGTITAPRTLTLPDTSGIICTDSGNCAGAGATLQTAYNFSVGGTTPKIKLNSTLLGFDIQDADTTIAANLFNVRASNPAGLGSVLFGVGSTGQVTMQNSANSLAAFRLLTQGGTTVMTGDTTNGQVILGQGGTLNGALVFNNASNANAITLTTAAATGAQTITLPNATGTVCLTSGNCSGTGSSNTLQAAYDAGNTISASNARNILFTLTDTATDPNFLVNLQCVTSCSTNGRFAVQSAGTDAFAVAPTGAITTGTAGWTQGGDITFSGTSVRTISGPSTGGLQVNTTSGPLTLSTTTSGILSLNSAGALNLSGAATSSMSFGTNALTLTASNYTVNSLITLQGGRAADITTGGTSITIAPGDRPSIGAIGANTYIYGGGASEGDGGSLYLDSGTGLNSNGAVYIGNTSASMVAVGAAAVTLNMTGIISMNANNNAATNINTGTSTGNVTIGAGTSTSGTIVLQGGINSAFTVTNATGTTKLNFAAPSTAGTVTFQLPAGGTGGTTYGVCTTLQVCTGYAPASGSANYIRNQTTVQAANMYIQAASAGTVAAAFQANGSGDVIDVVSSTGTTMAYFNSAGALMLQGTGTVMLNTPVGSNIPAKIVVSAFDPGSSGQAIAVALNSTANTTARGISVLDARTAAHQPSVMVFSPDETNGVGFSWNGSNSLANVQTLDFLTGGGTSSGIAVRSGNIAGSGSSGVLNLQSGSISGGAGGYSSGAVTLQSGDASGTAANSGNVSIDVGSATGTAGNIQIGWNTATAISLGRTSGVTNATTTVNGLSIFRPNTNSTAAFQVQNAGGAATVFDVDTSNGRVGIGTAAPGRTLDVAINDSTVNAPALRVLQGGTGNASLEFQNTNGGTSMYIGQDNGNSGAFAIGSSTAAPGTPGITFVQSITGHYNSGASPLTSQATSNFGSTVTAGNLLVVAVSFDTTLTSTFSCTDTLGNTFTNVTFINNPTRQQGLGVCYAANIVGGTDAVTAHFGGTGATYISVIATEYHNATTTPLDVSSTNFATATVSANGGTTGAATTTAAGDLVFAAFDDTFGEQITGAGTGLVQRGTTTGSTGIQTLVEDKTQATAGSTSATAGFSAADLYLGVMVTFKRVAAGSVTNTFNNSLMTISQSGAAKFQNYTDSTTAFQVQNSAGTTLLNVDTTNGYIGIGRQATTPWTALSVQDSQASNYIADIYNYNTGANAKGLLIQLGVANASRATTNYFAAFSDSTTVAGKIQGGANAVAYTTTGADYAEYFGAPSNDLPQPGELVAMDTANGRSVIRATNATKQVLPGVVSTNPGFIGNGPLCKINDDNCDTDYMKYNVLVSMTGQVPVKANTTNGPINIGDPIAISSVPGEGAKATSAGYIVGYAQESLTTGSGTIQVLIQPQHYMPTQSDILQGASLQVAGDASIGGTLNVGNLNVGGLATLAGLTVNGSATFKGNVSVLGQLDVQSIKVNGHIITAGAVPTVQALAATGVGASAIVSGTDTAGTIIITTGQGTVRGGDLAKLVFALAFGSEPRIQVTPVGAGSAGLLPYVSQTTADFTLGVIGTPVGGQTYTFNYSVMQ